MLVRRFPLFGPWPQIRHPSELTERDWENALRERQGGNGRHWGRHTRKFIFLSKCRTEKWHKEGQNNSFQRTFQLPIFKGRRIISMVSIRRHNTCWKHSLLFEELSHRQCAGVQASWILRLNVTNERSAKDSNDWPIPLWVIGKTNFRWWKAPNWQAKYLSINNDSSFQDYISGLSERFQLVSTDSNQVLSLF